MTPYMYVSGCDGAYIVTFNEKQMLKVVRNMWISVISNEIA